MKVAIVGSREFPNLIQVHEFVAKLAAKHPDAIVVSGGARGVDRAAEDAAHRLGLPVISFRPFEFEKDKFCVRRIETNAAAEVKSKTTLPHTYRSYGQAAFARNEDIVREAEIVCAFTIGSRGTANTLDIAERLGKDTWTFKPL